MPLNPDFPTNPYEILDPLIRWFPGDIQPPNDFYPNLLPPLVHKIREGVAVWRKKNYEGASQTSKALLDFWFKKEHINPLSDGSVVRFQYYFAQREAVESCIWLYEIEKSHDPISLLKYDSSKTLTPSMFEENWTRYVMKLATGAGKTKVMSLLVAWSYFHKKYELDSDLSTNFLITAPNIIVLDRLRLDFDGLKIFFNDPIIPEDNYAGFNWRSDFQINIHIQDNISNISKEGNIFLTNIHRVYLNEKELSINDDNTLDFFIGKRPVSKNMAGQADLGKIIRKIDDLVIINDEAHHFHDHNQAGFKNIQDISNNIRIKGGKLSAQFDLTATPKYLNGSVFIQTISDYPLVEAIRQRVVKTPVLPDEASRAKLLEKKSSKYCEMYEDYLKLGVYEWKKSYDELIKVGRKALLFVMTDETNNCDEVADYLESKFPELKGAVLTIHTNKAGEIYEGNASKVKKGELELLRKQSREMDSFQSPYKAIVSVMMLREGWDVQGVVSIVGLRAFSSKAKILPEQTLGRGLRKMFRLENLQEKVSIIGTEAFMEFVQSIKSEGVELEYEAMSYGDTKLHSPLVIEVDKANAKKDLEKLDIHLPILAPRIYREYKSLEDIDVNKLKFTPIICIDFTEEEQRQIIFKNIDTEELSHITELDSELEPSYQSMISYFTNAICRDLRLFGGKEILFGKLKYFLEYKLFNKKVDLNDLNILRNLSEPEITKTLIETFKQAINDLTVKDKGTTEIVNHLIMSKTRPYIVGAQEFFIPKKSLFNKIIGDSDLELDFAIWLDSCEDILSFMKNSQSTYFQIEYINADGNISKYIPDFIIKQDNNHIWIIEMKGREDLDDPEKWLRLKQWCEDATTISKGVVYRCIFIKQEDWTKHRARTFLELIKMYYSL